MNNDTIFALSSGHGKAGVAVIRISGHDLGAVAAHMANRETITPRHAYFSNLTDNNNELIDQCLILYFAGPHSFTGEDVIEIHTHGATAVIEKIFEFLYSQNMRMATPGEFSRRAFLNNKMDLSDVDGLAALLDAKTDQQRKHALRSMTGGDGRIYDAWRAQMIEIAAYGAAILDYADDELPQNIGEKIRARVNDLYNEINNALLRYAACRAIHSGFNITLAGDTNVGKSSLFNRILGANRAIVSDVPGTTRDVIDATIDIDGYMVNISDTAGIRETGDKIEKIGIERTMSEIENANLVIRVFTTPQNITAAENEIIVVNKSDLLENTGNENVIFVSAKTGAGMDKLFDAIREKMHSLMDGAENALTINARTKSLLENAANELKCASDTGNNYDIFAEHVRRAADNIGKILGTITAAEVMDATFSQLCLGK